MREGGKKAKDGRTRPTRAAVYQIVDFEITMHHHSVAAFSGDTGDFAGKDLLQLHERRNDHRLNSMRFQRCVAAAVPDSKSCDAAHESMMIHARTEKSKFAKYEESSPAFFPSKIDLRLV